MYKENQTNKTTAAFVPVMLSFFVMGFVDLVGAASNFVQKDLALTDTEANLFPSLVFFWFLLFSVPTGIVMNRIGRKRTVMISIAVTIASMLIPLFGSSYGLMLVAFSLLGIGNAIMQTSLNPLMTNIISGDKLASSLTFGQFVKAIASFLAPIIMSWGALGAFTTFGLGWRILFPIYTVIGIAAVLWLNATHIDEKPSDKASGFAQCLSLLGRPYILLCFIGIMCHVGIDVGTNTTAPKLLQERAGLPLEAAAWATSLYFIFRTIGAFTGSIIMRYLNPRNFLFISVLMMAAAMGGLFVAKSELALYVCIALIGYGNSNVFSIIFANALGAAPSEQNEVSGLMIMGLFGGTIFPLAMGLAGDAIGQNGAVAVMAVGVAMLFVYWTFKPLVYEA